MEGKGYWSVEVLELRQREKVLVGPRSIRDQPAFGCFYNNEPLDLIYTWIESKFRCKLHVNELNNFITINQAGVEFHYYVDP